MICQDLKNQSHLSQKMKHTILNIQIIYVLPICGYRTKNAILKWFLERLYKKFNLKLYLFFFFRFVERKKFFQVKNSGGKKYWWAEEKQDFNLCVGMAARKNLKEDFRCTLDQHVDRRDRSFWQCLSGRKRSEELIIDYFAG